MKIRIRGNSVRMRLTRSEVDQFQRDGYLSDKTNFGGDTAFEYALKSIETGLELTASYSNNCITVYMPKTLEKIWTTTETVGFEANMPLPENEKLFLLVEKDWKCIDGTTEDQSDMYANPNEELLK